MSDPANDPEARSGNQTPAPRPPTSPLSPLWPLSRMPLDIVPPLASLAALSALTSMLLSQCILPGLGVGSGMRAAQFPVLTQAARFTANLAVASGLITLVSSVSWALLGQPLLSLRRRILVLLAASVLANIALRALLFDPLSASRPQIYVGVVAANVIGVCVGGAAVSDTRGVYLRMLAALTTLLAMFNLVTILVDIFDPLEAWSPRVVGACKLATELMYLSLLVSVAPLLIPRGMQVRQALARSGGVLMLLLSLYAQYRAQRALRSDYALLVYSTQRVSLWLDRSPLLYALPFSCVLATTTTALISGGALRIQAACGILLLFAAGHATLAPGRLLSLALGFMLLSRALIAFTAKRSSPA